MSDKSRDAEPTHDDVVEPDATEPVVEPAAEVADDEETIVDDAAAPAIVRKTAKAPVRKTAPTKRRKDAVTDYEDHYKAKNPIEFAGQSIAELKKVVWPTWPQLVTMFFAVLVFVLIIIAIVGGLDVLFGWILLSLLGN